MGNFLLQVNQYAQLINFALFATIIGWLFQLSQKQKEVGQQENEAKLTIKDKDIAILREAVEHNKKEHELILEGKEQKIAILQERLELKEQQIKASEKQFQFISMLLQENVQKRLKDLDQEEKVASDEQKLEIQNKKNVLQNTLEGAKSKDYTLLGVAIASAIPLLITSVKSSTKSGS